MQTEVIETNFSKSFVVPKIMLSGPAKGTPYEERVNKTKTERYSVIKGTNIRHGPCFVVDETEAISAVWSLQKQSVVDRRTVSKREINSTYKDGELDGEVFQKNSTLDRRTGEMVVSLTVTWFYKDGVEYKDRVFGGPQGRKTEEWIAKRKFY